MRIGIIIFYCKKHDGCAVSFIAKNYKSNYNYYIKGINIALIE